MGSGLQEPPAGNRERQAKRDCSECFFNAMLVTNPVFLLNMIPRSLASIRLVGLAEDSHSKATGRREAATAPPRRTAAETATRPKPKAV